MSSRFDRFGKLENERTAPKEEEHSRPSLERFGAEPERAPQEQPAEPADPYRPDAGPLTRFSEDGGHHVRVEEDPLANLGFRRCPACERDSGKFDTRCYLCGASLTSPEAIALNMRLLEQREAEKAAEQAQQRDANVKQILEAVDEKLQKQREDEQSLSPSSPKGVQNIALVVGGIGCLVAAFAIHSYCPTFILLGLGVLLLGLRFPRVFAILGTHTNRRRWF